LISNLYARQNLNVNHKFIKAVMVISILVVVFLSSLLIS